MAQLPASNIVRSNATKVDGQILNTAKVANAAQGRNNLTMKITADATAAAESQVIIFPGSWDIGDDAKLPDGVTIDITDFPSRDAFLAYLMHNKFAIQGVEVLTNDTDNLIGEAGFDEYQKEVTGAESRKVTTQFIDYAVPNGGGSYSPKLNISAKDFTRVYSPIWKLILKSLKKSTSVTLKFNIAGQEKSAEVAQMSAMQF